MSVGACAVVDIGLWKYVKVFSGHSAGQHPETLNEAVKRSLIERHK